MMSEDAQAYKAAADAALLAQKGLTEALNKALANLQTVTASAAVNQDATNSASSLNSSPRPVQPNSAARTESSARKDGKADSALPPPPALSARVDTPDEEGYVTKFDLRDSKATSPPSSPGTAAGNIADAKPPQKVDPSVAANAEAPQEGESATYTPRKGNADQPEASTKSEAKVEPTKATAADAKFEATGTTKDNTEASKTDAGAQAPKKDNGTTGTPKKTDPVSEALEKAFPLGKGDTVVPADTVTNPKSSRKVSTNAPKKSHGKTSNSPAPLVAHNHELSDEESLRQRIISFAAFGNSNTSAVSLSRDIHGFINDHTGTVFGQALPISEAVESIHKVATHAVCKSESYQMQYWSSLIQSVPRALPPLTSPDTWFAWEQAVIDDVIATNSQYLFLVDAQLPTIVLDSAIHELRLDWWRARLLRCAPDSFVNRSTISPVEIYTYLFRKFENFLPTVLAKELRELKRGPQETSMEFRERANRIMSRFEQLGSSPEGALELLVNGFVMLGLSSEAERDAFAF